MIIFGARTRITKSNLDEVLEKSCPGCHGNLEHCDLKRWFTLYFIPIFPVSKIESFYKCDKCGQTYKEEIKEALIASKGNREKIELESKRLFFTTLAACMAHMAKIDGNISSEEETELRKLVDKSGDFKADVKNMIEKIKKSNDDDLIFKELTKAREMLTAEGIMIIIGQIGRMLLADGKIDKKEENLMKEYMLVCGISKKLFPELIKKIKAAENK